MGEDWRGLSPTRRVLDNGLVVIAKELRTSPAVAVSLRLDAGNAHDPPEHPGLAHFVARTVDRGTARRSAGAIADALDGVGVTLSVAATRHQFTFTLTCLADDLPAMVDLTADVARQPTFPADEVETRRAEILTSIRQDADNPAVVAVETLFELLYPAPHPYGRRAKGTVESVGRIDGQALASFHRERFSPDGACLVVVGDVGADRAVDVVSDAFGAWRAQGERARAARLRPPAAAAPDGRRERVVPIPGKAQADVAYGFVTVARDDPSYYDVLVMNNVLGQYALGGRLGDSIRERQGMAYYVFSVFDANVGEGPLVVRAGVGPTDVEKTIASIDEEIRRMAAEGITERELAETKQFLVGSIPRTLETNAGIAAFLQSVEFFGLGLDYDVRLPRLIGQVAREGVHEAARRHLDPDRAAVVIAGPVQRAGR